MSTRRFNNLETKKLVVHKHANLFKTAIVRSLGGCSRLYVDEISPLSNDEMVTINNALLVFPAGVECVQNPDDGETLLCCTDEPSVTWTHETVLEGEMNAVGGFKYGSDLSTMDPSGQNSMVLGAGTADIAALIDFWIPGKSTADGRTGAVNNEASGVGSTSIGLANIASGDYSHAEGIATRATGHGAHAEGIATVASGVGSHAEGDPAFATGDFSHAEGGTTIGSEVAGDGDVIAGGIASHAEGSNVTINSDSDYSHAEGNNNAVDDSVAAHMEGAANYISDSDYAHVEGEENVTLNSEGSHLEGMFNFCEDSIYAHLEGYNNEAINGANYSHCEGENNCTEGIASHAQNGWCDDVDDTGNIARGISSHAEGIASRAYGDASSTYNGYITFDEEFGSIAIGTRADGIASHAEGYGTRAEGDFSHIEGGTTNLGNPYRAQGRASHADCNADTEDDADYSHAETFGVTYGVASHAERGDAFGDYSHVEGDSGSETNGMAAHAEGGNNSVANGIAAHSEGRGPNGSASGDYSHKEGDGSGTGNFASHRASHAEGRDTIANGVATHAEGEGTRATGEAAHTQGLNTIAEGIAAHAQGESSWANGDYSFAGGRFARDGGNNNCFVWADSGGVTASAANQGHIRATGSTGAGIHFDIGATTEIISERSAVGTHGTWTYYDSTGALPANPGWSGAPTNLNDAINRLAAEYTSKFGPVP